jgi:methylmalonyl-CoA/ethylmalonyl-CoA epimerase
VTQPLFNETRQIGIVVPNLEAALKTYVEEYGIGPWQIFEYGPSNGADMIVGDEEVEYAMRVAITKVGSVEWELIEPLDDKSIYAQFLAQTGGGLHHVAVGIDSYSDTLQTLRSKGHSILQGGSQKGGGATYAYMSTDRDIGVITEIVDWPEGLEHVADAVYPEDADIPRTRSERPS